MTFLGKLKVSCDCKFIFYVSYFLMIFSDVFDNVSYLKNILNIFDILSVVLLFFILIKKIYDEKKSFLLDNNLTIIFGLVSIVVSIVSKNFSLLKLSFLILTFSCIDFDDFIKKDFILRGSLVISIMTMYFLNLVDIGIVEYRNGLMRNAFGMGHPNSFAFYLSILCLDLHYIYFMNHKKISVKPFIFSIILMGFNYLFVGARTNLILIIMIDFVFVLIRYIEVPTIMAKIMQHSFLIVSLVSIILGYLYVDNKIWNILNSLLSNRLYLSKMFLMNLPITLFGNYIPLDSFFVLDSAYINIFLRYGICITIVFTLMFSNTFSKLFSEKKEILCFVLVCLLIYGFSESPIYIPAKNPYILLLALGNYNLKNKDTDTIFVRKFKLFKKFHLY